MTRAIELPSMYENLALGLSLDVIDITFNPEVDNSYVLLPHLLVPPCICLT